MYPTETCDRNRIMHTVKIGIRPLPPTTKPNAVSVAVGPEINGSKSTSWPAPPGAGRYLYGSAASRRPSPKNWKASTTKMTGTAGAISHG